MTSWDLTGGFPVATIDYRWRSQENETAKDSNMSSASFRVHVDQNYSFDQLDIIKPC